MSKKKKVDAVNPNPEGENLENEGNPGENKDDKGKEGFLAKAKNVMVEKIVPAAKEHGKTVVKTTGKVVLYGMAAIGTVGTVLTAVAKVKAGKTADSAESEDEEPEEDTTPEDDTAEPTEE